LQTDLPAEGLRIPGFPKIIGPFSYQDVRANMTWSVVNINSLRNYLAARHNFAAAQLSADDARDLVVLTVATPTCWCGRPDRSEQCTGAGSHAKVSLDQAVANHQAGTARSSMSCAPAWITSRSSSS